MNKKITHLLFCFFVATIGQPIIAQQIYTNGPISTGGTSTTTTVAPAGYTWSELQAPNTSLGASAFNTTTFTSDFALADDFVVPAGETWNLTSVDFFGYQTGYPGTTVPIDALKVRIWDADPSLLSSNIIFGDMTTNVLNAANSGEAFVYRISSTVGTTRKIWKFNANVTISLAPGTYWIEYQVHAINDGSAFFPPVTILNTLSDPSWNAKQRNALAWLPLTDGGSTSTLAAPFNLNGAIVLANESFQSVSDISIFPNPATNMITIKNNSNSNEAYLEVYDITGRIVKSMNCTLDADVSIDISNLNSGNYILKVKSENGIAVKKFVKQ